MSISEKFEYFWESFQDREYRTTFVEETISSVLAAQIQEMREARGWTQEELAERTGKQQPQISQLEDPEYGRYTLKTLKQLASAFDVALTVRFEAYSDFARWNAELSPSSLKVPSFDEDTLKGSVVLTEVVNFQSPASGIKVGGQRVSPDPLESRISVALGWSWVGNLTFLEAGSHRETIMASSLVRQATHEEERR